LARGERESEGEKDDSVNEWASGHRRALFSRRGVLGRDKSCLFGWSEWCA
jgi:hypothetical protein